MVASAKGMKLTFLSQEAFRGPENNRRLNSFSSIETDHLLCSQCCRTYRGVKRSLPLKRTQ